MPILTELVSQCLVGSRRKSVRLKSSQLSLEFRESAPVPAHEETFEEALEVTFPVGEMTVDDLCRELSRLFPEI